MVLKAMGRSVGTDAKPKENEMYAKARALFDQSKNLERARLLLEKVEIKSRDRDLAADACYLLVRLAKDSIEAKLWVNRLQKQYPDHPNLLPAEILYNRIQQDLVEMSTYDPILGGFVLLPGDSTADSPVEMQSHEVTREEWERILGNGGVLDDRHPQSAVDVKEISEWLDKLNQRNDSWHYRLPTVSEWRRALGEGWPPSGALLSDYAWHLGNSCEKLQRVAVKQSTASGLHDLLGNVAEWCLDEQAGEWRLCGGSTLMDSTTMIAIPVEIPSERGTDSDVGFRLIREKKRNNGNRME
ncbi:MAG: SUMF1/EgtB/PvdO family nonheme iron enzyme [bacterium]